MRIRIWWFAAALLLSLIVALAHFYAYEHFLYWRYRWLDIPMHLLGGLALGALVAGVTKQPRALFYIAAIALVSVGLEVFEYVSGLTKHEAGYVADTAHDLIDDAVGAIVAYVLAKKSLWR